MAIAPTILAQTKPAAATETPSYTPGGTVQTTVSSVLCHNVSTTTADTAEVWLCKAGAVSSDTNKLWNINVPAEGTIILTVGLTLNTTDIFRVESTNGDTNFQFFGIEES